MIDFKVGDIVKVRFLVSGRELVKPSKVLAIKQNHLNEVLIETTSGDIIASAVVVPVDQNGVKLKADTVCPIGSSAYTREKAIKALGYRNVR